MPRSLAILVVLLIAVVAVIFVAGLGMNKPASATIGATVTPFVISQSASTPTPAATSVALSSDRVVSIKAVGNLLSANQASLAFQTGGRVKEIRVKEGDAVKAGTVLAILDTGTMELQVAQAQAGLDLAKAMFDKVKTGPTADDIAVAKSNLDRAKAGVDQAQAAYDRIGGAANALIAMMPQALALQQAIAAYQAAAAQYNLTVGHPTDTELRVAQAQVAQAQAAFDLAKQSLTNATILAPFDGTVISVNPKVGESVSPGVPAIGLADLSRMQVQVNLDETSLASVRAGQPVTFTLDALGKKEFSGRVFKIGLQGATAANIVSVPVTIDVDPTDAPIYPGLSALVSFQSNP